MPDSCRQLFLTFADAVFFVDATGSIGEANAAAAGLLGVTVEQLRGRNIREFLAPDRLDQFNEKWPTLRSRERLEFETSCIAAAGGSVNVLLDISHLSSDTTSAEGQEPRLVVARRASQHSGVSKELQLQRLSAGSDSGHLGHATFFVSTQGAISHYPPAAAGDNGRPLEWVAGLLTAPSLKPVLERVWAGEEVALPPAWYEPPAADAPAPDPGGPPNAGKALQRWLQLSFLPLRLHGADVTDVCVRVVDETKARLRSEEQRWSDQRRQRDLLAESLYHDLNNHLSVILAQASGLKLSTPPGQLPPSGIGAIIDAAQQVAGLLRGSSSGVTPAANGRQPVDLNAILPDCAAVLSHWTKDRLTVTMELGRDLPAVVGDETMLRTMVLALGRHIQAVMPAGSVLGLKTFRMPPSAPGALPSAGLTIGDDVVAAATARVAPSADIGTNADVALARAIVRAYHGRCESVSSTTQGTFWEVALPGTADQRVFAAAPAGAPRTERAGAEQPGAQCKVLLADDEENFRLFMSWALRERGFEVVAAKDGQEALDRFQEAPETFHLVILDAYMPRMGGLEAYLRMQVLRQDLPVLFASGFARGPTVDAMVAGCPGPATVLLKPFSAEDLLGAVKKALAPR